MSPQLYTTIYDAVVLELKKIAPETKFVGISVALETDPQWFEYFLNPAHHKAGVPLDGISYHFYGRPAAADQPIDSYQYSFFDQANGFPIVYATLKISENVWHRIHLPTSMKSVRSCRTGIIKV